jgi:iron-sulfur cluster repair protein YtfE (RIC family)
MNSQVDPLKRLIKDHRDVSEYLGNLREILGFLDEEKAWSELTPIKNFFERNVVTHFKFEEEVVFPAILSKCATSESIKLILELQREHGSILKDLEEFQKIIPESAIPLDKEMCEKVSIVGRGIIDSILPHASKEDDRLLPIIEKNRQIFEQF